MLEIQQVIALEGAVQDMRDGKAFYATKEESLGDYFIQCITKDIESILVHAGVHEQKFGCYRKLSKIFPYNIYYTIKDKTAYVVAILPMRRHPQRIAATLLKRH